MPDSSPTAAPPKRRWYQFSLRTMFVVVTVFCILLGTVGKQIVIPAERQRAAVRTIERLGGTVGYATTPDDESWLRRTLRTWLPSDYFDAIERVVVHNSKVSDADLDVLEDLTQLKRLDLSFTQVTDAGLVHLNGLRQLNYFSIYNTPVTDAGLVHLKDLTQLNWLDLNDTPVTDAGLVHLKELTQLKSLSLKNTRVTDAGLVHLTGLTQLVWLYLSKSQVTDAGVAKLQEALPNCRIVR